MRVELYSQKDRYLFVHTEEAGMVGWLDWPLGGRKYGRPSIRSLAGEGADLSRVRAIVFFAAGESDEAIVTAITSEAIYLRVADVDVFIDTLYVNDYGATFRTLDEVGLITGRIEGLVLTDLSGWRPHRYEHWIRGNLRYTRPNRRREWRRP